MTQAINLNYAYAIFCDDNNLERIFISDEKKLENLRLMKQAIEEEISEIYRRMLFYGNS